MRKYYLYLPEKKEQDVDSDRWMHLFSQIDRMYQEVRIYTAGVDFQKVKAKYPLPYAVFIDHNQEEGKKKSFENMWNMIMIDSGKTDEEYRPKNLEDINEDI